MKIKIFLDRAPAGLPCKVKFRWTITPPEGRVLLYRTETDPSPQELNGPSGEGIIEIVEPQTLYYEYLVGTSNCVFTPIGVILYR